MITDKQLIANRENGKLGGVKTEEGKAVSRMNATKHGLLSQEICLKDEDPEEFKKFRDDINNCLAPENALQNMLAEIIVNNGWKLKRMGKIENKTMKLSEDKGEDEMQMYLGSIPKYDTYEKFNRYGSTMEKRVFRAMNEFDKLKMGSFRKK